MLVLLFLPVLSVSPLSRFTGFLWIFSSSFPVFVRCTLPVGVFSLIFRFFFVFGYPGGGHGRVLFQLRGGFSAEAGTVDFE